MRSPRLEERNTLISKKEGWGRDRPALLSSPRSPPCAHTLLSQLVFHHSPLFINLL